MNISVTLYCCEADDDYPIDFVTLAALSKAFSSPMLIVVESVLHSAAPRIVVVAKTIVDDLKCSTTKIVQVSTLLAVPTAQRLRFLKEIRRTLVKECQRVHRP